MGLQHRLEMVNFVTNQRILWTLDLETLPVIHPKHFGQAQRPKLRRSLSRRYHPSTTSCFKTLALCTVFAGLFLCNTCCTNRVTHPPRASPKNSFLNATYIMFEPLLQRKNHHSKGQWLVCMTVPSLPSTMEPKPWGILRIKNLKGPNSKPLFQRMAPF